MLHGERRQKNSEQRCTKEMVFSANSDRYAISDIRTHEQYDGEVYTSRAVRQRKSKILSRNTQNWRGANSSEEGTCEKKLNRIAFRAIIWVVSDRQQGENIKYQLQRTYSLPAGGSGSI